MPGSNCLVKSISRVLDFFPWEHDDHAKAYFRNGLVNVVVSNHLNAE